MGHRIAAVSALLTFLLVVVLCPSSAQQVQAPASDSVEELQSQMNAILESAKTNHSKKNLDPKRFDDLVSNLRIPANSNWFSVEFGDEIGAKLASEYGRSWGSFQDALTRGFSGAADSKPKKTLVTAFGSSSPFGKTNMTSIQQSAKSSLALYEVVVETG